MPKLPEDFSVARARQLQLKWAKKIVLREISLDKIRLIGGVDVSYLKMDAVAVAAILEFPALNTVEVRGLRVEVKFPYVPTLLSFREAPPIIKLVRMLKYPPDILMVEGHGLAHPYGCGLASHVGVILKIPTIGVAKGLLCGKIECSDGEACIVHEGKVVGAQVEAKSKFKHAKPIYVSVGNMITLSQAVEIVKRCIKLGFRMPEPLRIAHMIASHR